MLQKEKILDLLKDYNLEDVEKFASYIIRLQIEKKKDGTIMNPWIQQKNEEELCGLFRRIAKDGLTLDGAHITLSSTGISYDYVALKNRMLLVYPESQIDVSLVYDGDEFTVAKESGSVIYHHNISNPLNQKGEQVIGGYCVIKNKRGEFITILSKEDIEQHRKVAKMDFIWKQWFKEMALKTVIKKAVKQHFADIYENIINTDNENSNLDIPLTLEMKYKQEIDAIETLEELKTYYDVNKGKGEDFDKYITIRKSQLTK